MGEIWAFDAIVGNKYRWCLYWKNHLSKVGVAVLC